MALSTCIRTAAMDLVERTSSGSICWPLCKNGGMFKRTPSGRRRSSISKPLSAITESPRSSLSRRPLAITRSRSDIDPSYRSEIKVKAPSGEMPTSNLQVLWFLYAEKDALCISNELGRWMKNSVQSIIIRVEGYSILKHDGMFLTIFLREGNTSSSRNFTYMRFIHVTNTRLSVEGDTFIRSARSTNGYPLEDERKWRRTGWECSACWEDLSWHPPGHRPNLMIDLATSAWTMQTVSKNWSKPETLPWTESLCKTVGGLCLPESFLLRKHALPIPGFSWALPATVLEELRPVQPNQTPQKKRWHPGWCPCHHQVA